MAWEYAVGPAGEGKFWFPRNSTVVEIIEPAKLNSVTGANPLDTTKILRLTTLPDRLLTDLNAREAAVWVMDPFVAAAGGTATASVVRLPWRLALSESADPVLVSSLEAQEDLADPLVSRRGFVHVLNAVPESGLLPPRCLPVYLLGGRDPTKASAGFASQLRRLTMIEELRKSGVRQILVLAGPGPAIPPELAQIWADGFRTTVISVADGADAEADLTAWRVGPSGDKTAVLHPASAVELCQTLPTRYLATLDDSSLKLRIRNVRGMPSVLDCSRLDDAERPLLDHYELLQDRDLRPLMPIDLLEKEIQAFFLKDALTWRPYAAGMPWSRAPEAWNHLKAILKRTDVRGPETNRIAYVSSESGAGGTTLVRQLAWTAAAEGYPTLVARPGPFMPEAVEITTFIGKIGFSYAKVRKATRRDAGVQG